MRKALIVGISDYSFGPLNAAVNDAESIAEMLATNDDDNNPYNFECQLLVSGTSKPTERKGTISKTRGEITKGKLKAEIVKSFEDDTGTVGMAVFYFAGHGYENETGGYLVTQDASRYDEGVSMYDVIQLANRSPIHEVVIILDCCHAGNLGNIDSSSRPSVTLRQGVSILTSSSADQSSLEEKGAGLFTSILCTALSGGAADITGNVTIASLYNYADKMLGALDQRPLFKCHVARLSRLRKCKPQISIGQLKYLTEYFDPYDAEHALDPSYEWTEKEVFIKEHGEIFGRLQTFARVGLVEPVGEKHMYFAAIRSKSCRLTPVGQFYWHLVKKGRLSRLA